MKCKHCKTPSAQYRREERVGEYRYVCDECFKKHYGPEAEAASPGSLDPVVGLPMKILSFACGAIYEAENTPLDRKGHPKHLMVYAAGNNVSPPHHENGQPAQCLWRCPAPVRKSKRQQLKAWVGDDAITPTGEPVWCVRCKPTHIAVKPQQSNRLI